MKLFLLCVLSSALTVHAKTMTFAYLGNGATDVSSVILKEAYAELGIHAEFVSVPGKRSLDLVNGGALDGEVARGDFESILTQYPNLIRVPQHINYVDWRVYSLKPMRGEVSFDALSEYSIALRRGILFTEGRLDDFRVSYVEETHLAFQLVDSGRVDMTVAPLIVANNLITNLALKGVVSEQRLGIQRLYHYVHKRHAAVVPSLNQILVRLVEEGRVEQIRAQYLEKPMHNGGTRGNVK